MKRIGGLIEKIADMDNLYLAFWKARKGKNGQDRSNHRAVPQILSVKNPFNSYCPCSKTKNYGQIEIKYNPTVLS